MMLGIDVVDVQRFQRTLARTPRLAERFFTPGERAYCDGSADPFLHLAATFAAKEAVMKALRIVPAAAAASRIEILRRAGGAPVAIVDGHEIPLSISHDGPIVVAVALSRYS